MNTPPAPDNKTGYFDSLVRQQAFASEATDKALKRLSDAKTDDVTAIASSQIELLSRFYDLSLSQASRSFRWALLASAVGLLFFLMAIAFLLWGKSSDLSVITLIGGAMIEFIAGINFYLYSKTIDQLNLFQGKLEITQRFLLANSLCESLSDPWKDETRAQLIGKLSGSEFTVAKGEAAHPAAAPA